MTDIECAAGATVWGNLMVLLFRPEHEEAILLGKKTQTRRIWKRQRVKVGSLHKAKTKLFSKDYFAILKITGVRSERLGDISEADAQAEGGYTPETYRQKWIEINGSWNPDQLVFVVDFVVAETQFPMSHAPAQIAEEDVRELIPNRKNPRTSASRVRGGSYPSAGAQGEGANPAGSSVPSAKVPAGAPGAGQTCLSKVGGSRGNIFQPGPSI